MDCNVGQQQQPPCHSTYINLRNVGLNSNAGLSPLPSAEELGLKPVLRPSQTFVWGCKHFPEVEAESKANWSCEFCDGARLIEEASRSNEAVSSLDIDKLLCDYSTSCESIRETTPTLNAVEPTYSKMGSWVLKTRARDTPAS